MLAGDTDSSCLSSSVLLTFSFPRITPASHLSFCILACHMIPLRLLDIGFVLLGWFFGVSWAVESLPGRKMHEALSDYLLCLAPGLYIMKLTCLYLSNSTSWSTRSTTCSGSSRLRRREGRLRRKRYVHPCGFVVSLVQCQQLFTLAGILEDFGKLLVCQLRCSEWDMSLLMFAPLCKVFSALHSLLFVTSRGDDY